MNDIEFLKKSNPPSMVIPSGARQGFNLILYSTVIRPNESMKMSLKYTINYKPTCTFKMYLRANVIPVTIKKVNELSKFQFKNEKATDKKVEMSITQKLEFLNLGNAPADFFWDQPKDKIWSIEPMTGRIFPKGPKFFMDISFTPKSEIYNKYELEEDLKLNLVNGPPQPMVIKVLGTVSPAVCKLVAVGGKDSNAPGDVLNFDFVHIGIEETKEFHIKNEKSLVAAYSIVIFYNKHKII